MINRYPPWIKATSEGRLYLDTSNPEWIKYFSKFIIDSAGRMNKYINSSKPKKNEENPNT